MEKDDVAWVHTFVSEWPYIVLPRSTLGGTRRRKSTENRDIKVVGISIEMHYRRREVWCHTFVEFPKKSLRRVPLAWGLLRTKSERAILRAIWRLKSLVKSLVIQAGCIKYIWTFTFDSIDVSIESTLEPGLCVLTFKKLELHIQSMEPT